MGSELLGNIALVTGSTKGIGYSIARELSAQGCKVVLNGRVQEGVEQAVNSLPGSIGVCADVTEPQASIELVSRCIQTFGRLNMLVCNVGTGKSVAPGCESMGEWQRMFAANLFSATNMVEAARTHLSKTKGSIVCISSICGSEAITGAPVTYSVAKAALNSYVRGISIPLGRIGIRINAVSPGNIIFPGSVWERKIQEDAEGVTRRLRSEVALGRFGTPEHVAELTAYLLSERAEFATGAVWTIDGGQRRGYCE